MDVEEAVADGALEDEVKMLSLLIRLRSSEPPEIAYPRDVKCDM